MLGNQSNPNNNIFNRPMNQQNNAFSVGNKPNIFAANPNKPPAGGGIFGQGTAQNQGQGQGIFNQGTSNQTGTFANMNQGGNSMFNSNPLQPAQNPGTNNFFNNTIGGTGGNFMGQATTQGGGLFNPGNATQTGGNMFNQGSGTQGGGNLFNPGSGTQGGGGMFNQGTLQNPTSSQPLGGMYNQGSFNQTGTGFNLGGNQINLVDPLAADGRLQQILNLPLDMQKKLIQNLNPDYIRQKFNQFRKAAQASKAQKFQISSENPLRTEKIVKVANALNIKPQIIQIQKAIRDNLKNKIKKLKEDKLKLQTLSVDFSKNVYQKLQKYKEKLISSIVQTKMIEEARQEVTQIEQEIFDFFKPLFNAQQNKTNFNFSDPNPFCVSVSQKLLKNMIHLDNRMDEVLAYQANNQQAIDTADVIMQLIEYYQNVAVAVKQYTTKYNQLKRLAIQHSQISNTEQAFRRFSQQANTTVRKEMEAYEIVKQIQTLLERKNKRLSQQKL